MKNKKTIYSALTLITIMLLCFTSTNILSKTNKNQSKTKDCCMMKGGKMMVMMDGKMMPMEKNMTMKNGTKCMTNGECIMKDGTKMKMKEGQCMDMSGKMDKCSMMSKGMKSSNEKKSDKKDMAKSYTCPMHPEIMSDKDGNCPKCGMNLVEKK